MKNKFIKTFLVISILLLSITKGDTHFITMSNIMNIDNSTSSHCSNSGMTKEESTDSLKASYDFCEFSCHLIFFYTHNITTDILTSYKDSFYFHSKSQSLKLIDIFKPPIFT